LKAKVGVLRLSSAAPVFIAQDKGYFRDEGLDIELKFFDAAQPVAVATTSGDVDFGITAFTAGLYNLAGKGALKVIGGMSRERAGYPLIGYFASNKAQNNCPAACANASASPARWRCGPRFC
jgi:NitT/TauT family transport system substrate-binding protein